MTQILYTTNEPKTKWKDFTFPLAIKDISLKENAKVATYTYAGRNGAEHERVLAARSFSVSGEFIYGADDRTPEELVEEFRLTNDNKPGVLSHPHFGSFTCIMSSLTIGQNGEGYTYLPNEDSGGIFKKLASLWTGNKPSNYHPSFTFSAEFLEHTPPNAKTLKEKNDELFPKSVVKPLSDDYNESLIYKNCDQMYEAIITGKISPGVNPVVHSEWLKYDYGVRKCAFDRWKEGGYQVNSTVEETPTVNTNKRSYIVRVGETGTGIAKKHGVAFTDLFQANHGIEVRTNPVGTEGLYRKTSHKLYPGDRLLVPNS